LENSLAETGIQARVKQVGCRGMCYLDPFLEVRPPDQKPVLYHNVQPKEVKRILRKHFKPKSIKKRLTNTAVGI